jgi:hypothetical protein
MTMMSNEDPADPGVHESQTAAWALKLAEVPIVSRGMGWQSNATATLREAAAELDRLRAREDALLDVALMLKRCAWALRRGTAPDLGERALYLLQKHDLLGGPLRDEAMPAACPTAAGCREHGCHGACHRPP